jgi:hypothetical protein
VSARRRGAARAGSWAGGQAGRRAGGQCAHGGVVGGEQVSDRLR